MKRITPLGAAATLLMFTAVLSAAEPAYRQQITTPHWQWIDQHAGGTVRALFLVNNLATREPDELAQRFDLAATVVPVTGDPYRNKWDDDALLTGLADRPDVIVLAATKPWQHLSEDAKKALREAVADGIPLAVFGGPTGLPPWDELIGDDAVDLTTSVGKTLAADAIAFRRPFRATMRTAGKGRILLAAGFDQHWTFFSAFQPSIAPDFDSTLHRELTYALCSRLIRIAAGKQPAQVVREVQVASSASAGKNAAVQIVLANPVTEEVQLHWALHSEFGDRIDQGHVAIAANKDQGRIAITPQHGKVNVLRWRLEASQQTIDFGAVAFDVIAPATLSNVQLPDLIEAESELPVQWQTTGDVQPGDRVMAQVYDPDGRLVSTGSSSASTGAIRLGAWVTRYASHQCRLLFMRNGTTLDEVRLPVQVRLDRASDLKRFHVIVWGTELGHSVERCRYPQLRRLGVTAMAPIGGSHRLAAARWMSRSGLRLVPTNVFVPPNRYTNKKTYSQAKDEKKLGDFAAEIARYSVLGYSLADEPNTKNWSDWVGLGAKIIHEHDPGALVGLCGVKLSMDKDVPGFFEACDFAELYSPFYLYNPNLWDGIERDLYRSFLREDGIYTCWTHYAPWADHEPYSRTVPWLWLFEGLNGVSYFSSAANFGILESDLRPSHESRWWSEEVLRLHEGIGEQIIALQRDEGFVRIICEPGSTGYHHWALALNQANVAYRFTRLEDLADDHNAKLVICTSHSDLSASRLAPLRAVAERGGIVVVVAPVSPDAGRLLGWRSSSEQDIARYKGVPATAKWEVGSDRTLGVTSGVHGLKPTDASVVARFHQLGEAVDDARKDAPAFIQKLFDTPAALSTKYGAGTILTLTFHPDLKSAKTLLGRLMGQAGINPPRERISVTGHSSDTVYLYPFDGERMRLVGVIQDYARVPATLENPAKNTRGYFHHGPKRWASSDAKLTLAQVKHVYDVRAGKYLGKQSDIAFPLQPGRPEMFALMPYKVTDLAIEAPKQAKPGQTLDVNITVNVDDGLPDRHVVHLTLTGPNGDTYKDNIHTEDGRASHRYTVAFNAIPGTWTLTARDAVSGVTATRHLVVAAEPVNVGPLLSHETPIVARQPLEWDEGQWTAIVDKTEDKEPAVNVSISPIVRKRQWHIGGHKGQWALMGSFTMRNPLVQYGVKYLAVNDWKANKWSDPRQVAAPYLPGLGFTKPRPHMWYYNSYMTVRFDGINATRYAITRMEQVEQPDGRKRVEVMWDTPYGEIELAFVMLPNHRGMFQELIARPTKPIRKLEVGFNSYPTGFGKGSKLLKIVDPEHKAWVLIGDATRDRAFGQGWGPGALLVLPEQWEEVNYNPRGPALTALVDADAEPLTVDQATPHDQKVEPIGEIRLHWVLWMFPEMSNAKAFDYMENDSRPTQDLLRSIFK